MREYKLIHFKKSITGLFGVGDGVIEYFDNVMDAYERYSELKKHKNKYLIHIYKLDNKITFEQFFTDFKKEVERLNNEITLKRSISKTFKKNLNQNEREFGRLYVGCDIVFRIFITDDYRIGVYNVNVTSLLHLLDTNPDFKTAFILLTEIMKNKKTFNSSKSLGKAIEGIMDSVGYGIEVKMTY